MSDFGSHVPTATPRTFIRSHGPSSLQCVLEYTTAKTWYEVSTALGLCLKSLPIFVSTSSHGQGTTQAGWFTQANTLLLPLTVDTGYQHNLPWAGECPPLTRVKGGAMACIKTYPQSVTPGPRTRKAGPDDKSPCRNMENCFLFESGYLRIVLYIQAPYNC